MAVVDYFLKIDGIEGESLQKGHEREIEISGFEWSCENSGSFAANLGGGSGKVKMRDFQFQVPVNRASPKLFLACCTGEHIKKATLSCRKAGMEAQEYLTWTFIDLLISSYTVVAGDDSGGGQHVFRKASIGGGGTGSTSQPSWPHPVMPGSTTSIIGVLRPQSPNQVADGPQSWVETKIPIPVERRQTLPTDLISFNFTKIEVSYAPQKADGSLEASILAGFDLKTGVKAY